MRRIVLFLIFFQIAAGNIFAQSFKHFPDSAVWNIRYHYGHPPYYYFNYQLLGDTIVGAYTYKKLNGGNSLIALIREDTVQNKVYARVFRRMTFYDWVDCNTQPLNCLCADSVLFDYNLSLGDTFSGIVNFIGYSSCTYKVICLDSVYLGSVWRKRWSLGLISGSTFSPPCGPEGIIEGIGTYSGLFESMGLGISGELSELQCFGTASQSIYPVPSSLGCSPTLSVDALSFNDNIISIFPNPTTGMLTLQMIQPFINSTIIISNALGEKIFEQKFISEKTEIDLSRHPKGIYFVNVKQRNKFVVKKIVLM